MKLFKHRKLNNTQIRPLLVIPTKHIHIKYLLIISLIIFTFILNNRLYEVVTHPHQCSATIVKEVVFSSSEPSESSQLTSKIAMLYNVTYDSAKEIVNAAIINSNPTFPTVYDTLAIIAIESKFNITAQSKTSKAKGLMQVLYKDTTFNIEQNISDGVSLLLQYKDTVKTEEAAIESYNVGVGAYLAGKRNIEYLNKFKQEKQRIMA